MWSQLGTNLLGGALLGLLGYLLGYLWPQIPFSKKKRRIRKFIKFWGDEATLSEQLLLVLSVVHDPRLLESPRAKENRYYKDRPGKGRIFLRGPFEPMSTCDARAVGYLSSEFAFARKQPPKIVTDEDILDKWEAIFICFGSSDSNFKTGDILELEENIYAAFGFKNGDNAIKTKWDNSSFTWKDEPYGDKGLIMKLPNPRFPNHTLTVCAGLGEYGTSGAAFYLSRHWEMLYKRYKGHPFCVIVAVSQRSDESATPIAYSPPPTPAC